MTDESDSAGDLARLSLAFEDVAKHIRQGAEAGGLTLSEVRLLDGIARGTTGARMLSRQLGLDEGHVSRMVRRLRDTGLVTGERQSEDARRVVLALTATGQERLRVALDGAREAAARTLGAPRPGARAALVPALAALTGPADPDIALTGLEPGDGGWVIEQHGRFGTGGESRPPGFEAAVARIVADVLEAADPEHERGWIARANGQRLGAVFCTRATEGGSAAPMATARLRLIFVLPEVRRRGLGLRLVEACRDFAAGAGYSRLILHADAGDRAASALCERFGFARAGSAAAGDHARGGEEQIWSLELGEALAKAPDRG